MHCHSTPRTPPTTSRRVTMALTPWALARMLRGEEELANFESEFVCLYLRVQLNQAISLLRLRLPFGGQVVLTNLFMHHLYFTSELETYCQNS